MSSTLVFDDTLTREIRNLDKLFLLKQIYSVNEMEMDRDNSYSKRLLGDCRQIFDKFYEN